MHAHGVLCIMIMPVSVYPAHQRRTTVASCRRAPVIQEVGEVFGAPEHQSSEFFASHLCRNKKEAPVRGQIAENPTCASTATLRKEAVNREAGKKLRSVLRQQQTLHAQYGALASLASTPFYGTYADNIACASSISQMRIMLFELHAFRPLCFTPCMLYALCHHQCAVDRQTLNLGGVCTMVVASAQASGLHERIMSLPRNYWTIIGTEQDAVAVDEQQAAHRVEAQDQPRYDAQPGPIHVPNAVEGELLALARKNYLALRAAQRRLHVHSHWQSKHAQRPLGDVPDFTDMHRALAERTIQVLQGAVSAGMTVPLEFELQRRSEATKVERLRHVRQRRVNLAWLKTTGGADMHPCQRQVWNISCQQL